MWEMDPNSVLKAGTGSSEQMPGFGSWTEADPNDPALLFFDFVVSGSGTGTGEVAIDVDETGDLAADYTYNFTVQTGLAGTITTSEQAVAYVQDAGQYRVRNVSDPNGNNAVNAVRIVSL